MYRMKCDDYERNDTHTLSFLLLSSPGGPPPALDCWLPYCRQYTLAIFIVGLPWPSTTTSGSGEVVPLSAVDLAVTGVGVSIDV